MSIEGVTSTGHQSLDGNPAGLGHADNMHVFCRQFNHYHVGDWNDVSVDFSWSPRRSVGIESAFRKEGFEGFRTTRIPLGIGISLGKKIDAGISIEYLSLLTTTDRTLRTSRMNATAGCRIAMSGKTVIGFVLRGIPAFFSNNPYPVDPSPSITSGFTWMPSATFSIHIELVADNTGQAIMTGIEYVPNEAVACRLGYDARTGQFSGGAGYRIGRFSIDAAVKHHPFLGLSTGICLDYRLTRP
jgi:hypothetical protein